MGTARRRKPAAGAKKRRQKAKKPTVRQTRERARASRRARLRPPPSTHEVFGLRCRVRDLMLLDETLVLVSDEDGKQFALPLPVLVGRDALVNIAKGQVVWIAVRVEGKRQQARAASVGDGPLPG
jgi:hypothetical protein